MITKFLQTVLFITITTFANAQISQNMTLVGNWNPGGFPTAGSLMYNDIWGYADCSGNEYAIMGGAAYYHFIDITNPGSPVEVASILGGNTTTWRDMKTYSKYAYGVCDSCNEGLSVFDLGDLPNSVTMVGQYTSSFNRAHNIFIDEGAGRLYAVGTNTQGNGVIVFDLNANPANPPEIARMSLPGGYMHDLFVRGNIGYGNSGGNGMWVYDFTNLSNVTTLGNITSYPEQGYNHAGWATDDNQGYVMADETHDKGLKYLDISDLTDISTTSVFRSELLAPAVTGSIAHNPFIRDNYAIVSYYHDGLQVFDISDPNNVIQTAWYDTYTGHSNYSGYAGNWGAYPFLPSGNILASDEFTGLYILNPTNITFNPIPAPSPPSISILANGTTNFCTGESVVLTANHSGIAVQWYKDDVMISGATDDDYTATEAGVYYAETAGFGCSANSSDITITIVPAPDVTLNVANFNQICDNESLTITAPAGAASYSWTRNGSLLLQNSNSITVNQAGDYQVEISNGSCSALSIVANLTVEVTPDATLNVSGSQEICDGETVNLFVASGADNYQWTKDNVPFGGNVNSITVSESGDYKVIVSDGICADESETITFITNAYPDVSLNNNGPIQICDGESEVLAVGSGADSYTWFKDGSTIVGTDFSIDVSESGTYFVEASNGNCESTSQTVTVDVGVEPDVTLNVPTNQILCEGEVLEISVPTGANNYTWYQNGVVQSSSSNPSFFAAATGDYYVLADINGCTSTSEVVSILVETYPNVNLNVPNFNEICEGEQVMISAPSGADSYQWFRNGVLFAADMNTIFATESGDYYVIASNGNCQATSNITNLTVQTTPDVSLNMTGMVAICEGQTQALFVPDGAQNYQWLRNGTDVVGTGNGIDVSLSGTYQVIASNGNCENVSEIVTIEVNQFPVVDLNVPLVNSICDGETLTINVAAGASSYAWFLNGNSLGNTTNSITATAAGNYQVIASNGNCEVASDMVNVIVNVTPSVALNVPNFNQICAGEEVVLTVPAGASSYSWLADGSPIANNTNSITVASAGMYEVTASNGTCAATSETVEIVVNAFPETTLNVPLANQICDGETIELSVPSGAATYQWYQNGNLLSQTENTITVSASGDYQVIAANGNCSATSEMANVNVTSFPNVDLSMPLQNEICAGETLPISVATGADNYQWFLNGDLLAANTAEITATEAGNYSVTASNGNCEVTSETLNLTVSAFPETTLNVPLANQICDGETIELSVPSGAATYQWYQNGNLLLQTDNTITVSATGDYQVIAANGNCSATSETANVNVTSFPNVDLSMPLQNEICAGETLPISVATGADNYQWFLNGDLLAANTAEIIATEAGNYSVTASNGNCEVTSETVALTVIALPNVDLSVTSMNQICTGETLTIEAAGDADNFAWYQNGDLLPISGNALTVSESGNYQLIATNANCAVTSEMVTVEVVETPSTDLNVDTENEICAGETLLLEAIGGSNNYQWFLNGEATGNNDATLTATTAGEYFVMIGSGDCSAVSETINLTINEVPDVDLNVEMENTICTGESLDISVAAGADSYVWYYDNEILIEGVSEVTVFQPGIYHVVATIGSCESISETIELTTVNPPNPSLTALANFEYKICEEETFTVSVAVATGSYQWFLNDEAVAGATDQTFITSEAGTYYVELSNDYCTVTSASFDVVITPTPTPVLAQAGEQSICEGFAFGMSVATDADSFEWYYNGEGLGSNGPQFIVTEPGEYYVVAENDGCEGISESVFLTINEFPEADIQTTAVQICPGETATLSTPSIGQTYQWFLNFFPIAGANDVMLDVSEGGIYFVSLTNESCTSVSANVQISVFVPMTPEVSFDGEALTATPANAYQWFLNGNPITGATDGTFLPTENGDYSVQTTDANGCESMSDPLNVLIDAVQDVTLANGFLLYPNPVLHTLFLENKGEHLQQSRLQVFNTIGQVVFDKSLNFVNNHTEQIEVERWPAGVYILKVETVDGQFFVKRFVKE